MSEAADDILSSLLLMTEEKKVHKITGNKLAVYFVKNEMSCINIQSLAKEFNNRARVWTVSSQLYIILQNRNSLQQNDP